MGKFRTLNRARSPLVHYPIHANCTSWKRVAFVKILSNLGDMHLNLKQAKNMLTSIDVKFPCVSCIVAVLVMFLGSSSPTSSSQNVWNSLPSHQNNTSSSPGLHGWCPWRLSCTEAILSSITQWWRGGGATELLDVLGLFCSLPLDITKNVI